MINEKSSKIREKLAGHRGYRPVADGQSQVFSSPGLGTIMLSETGKSSELHIDFSTKNPQAFYRLKEFLEWADMRVVDLGEPHDGDTDFTFSVMLDRGVAEKEQGRYFDYAAITIEMFIEEEREKPINSALQQDIPQQWVETSEIGAKRAPSATIA